MVGHGAEVGAGVVEHIARHADYRHPEIAEGALAQILAKEVAHVAVVVEHQGVVELVVAALQAQCQRLYLVLTLAILLEHNESDGEYEEKRQHAHVYLSANGEPSCHGCVCFSHKVKTFSYI